MKVELVCRRRVFVIRADQPLAEAAREMQQRQVGALVVVEERNGLVRPIGMLTDRDIVCGQFAHEADLHLLTVGEVMASPAISVLEELGVEEAVGVLRTRGVRRAPVVNTAGDLVGIITLDDLLPALTGELTALAELIGTQACSEADIDS